MSGRYPPEEVIVEALLLLLASGMAVSVVAVAVTLVGRAWGRMVRRWAKRPRRPDLYIVGHVERGRASVHLVGRDRIELICETPFAAGPEPLAGEWVDDLAAKGLLRGGTARGRRRLHRALYRNPDRGFVLEVSRANALLAYLPVAGWLDVGRRALDTAVEHARRRCRGYLERPRHRRRNRRSSPSARGAS